MSCKEKMPTPERQEERNHDAQKAKEGSRRFMKKGMLALRFTKRKSRNCHCVWYVYQVH